MLRIDLDRTSGRVLVIRDEVYVIAQPGLELQSGDRVVTREEASAGIRYLQVDEAGEPIAEICDLTVPAAHQLEIGDATDCRSENLMVPVIVSDGTTGSAASPEEEPGGSRWQGQETAEPAQ